MASSADQISRRAVLSLCGAGIVQAMRGAGPALAGPEEVVVGKNGWLFPAFDRVNRVDHQRIREGAALINDAVGILKRADIKTVICLTPAKSRVYSEFLPDAVKFVPDAERRYAFDLEALRRSGTVVPDLSAAMSAVHKAEPGTQLFFKGDTHWTPQGAACAAGAIAETIKRDGLLPPSPKPGDRLGVPRDTTQNRNDLASLLPPDQRSKYPLEAYRLPHAIREQNAGLLAEEGADTVLVGNSYLHPLFGFSVTLSSLLNRPVWLVWKVHAFSPYWNLLDYLASPAFTAQKPKLIVWVFHETDLSLPPDNSAVWGQTAMKPAAILADLRRRVAA